MKDFEGYIERCLDATDIDFTQVKPGVHAYISDNGNGWRTTVDFSTQDRNTAIVHSREEMNRVVMVMFDGIVPVSEFLQSLASVTYCEGAE